MADELEFDNLLSEFEPHSHDYVYFRNNTVGKGMNSFIPLAMF